MEATELNFPNNKVHKILLLSSINTEFAVVILHDNHRATSDG